MEIKAFPNGPWAIRYYLQSAGIVACACDPSTQDAGTGGFGRGHNQKWLCQSWWASPVRGTGVRRESS